MRIHSASAILLLAGATAVAQEQPPLRPEDLHLQIQNVESDAARGRLVVQITAKTVLPDGSPWGEGLSIQAEAQRIIYGLQFRDDWFSFPQIAADQPRAATARIGNRGAIEEFELEPGAPGIYRVQIYLDPVLQNNQGALNQLRRMMRVRRDEGLPRIQLGEFEVWAGRPRDVLPDQIPAVQAYWSILTEAGTTFHNVQRQVEQAQGDEWMETAMAGVNRLLDLKDQAQHRRDSSLLAASFGFVVDTLTDLEQVSRSMRDRLNEQHNAHSGGGGGGGGGGGPQGTTTVGDASDEWGGPGEIPDTKEDLGENEPIPIQATTYGGALTLNRMEMLLELAPIYAVRETLLWYIRFARRGVDEIHGAWEAATATEVADRDEAVRGLRAKIREWRDLCGRMPDTIRELERAAESQSRRLREFGWDRYFEGVPELFDNPGYGGLMQYVDGVEALLGTATANQETNEVRQTRERLEQQCDQLGTRYQTLQRLHPQSSGEGGAPNRP